MSGVRHVISLYNQSATSTRVLVLIYIAKKSLVLLNSSKYYRAETIPTDVRPPTY